MALTVVRSKARPRGHRDIRHVIKTLPDKDRERLRQVLTPRFNPEYCPHKPHPPQQVFMSLNNIKEVMYGGAAGGGKKLEMSCPVLTTKGWKRNDELRVGDSLIDPRTGGNTTVIATHTPTEEVVYEVEFEDGTVIDACGDHLWTVRQSGKRRRTWDRRFAIGEDDPYLNGYRVMSTTALRDAVQLARRQASTGNRPNYPHVPVPRAMEFSRPYRNIHATLPIDPYLLGLVLGDGWVSKSGTRLHVCTADDETREFVAEWAGESLRVHTDPKKQKNHYFTTSTGLMDFKERQYARKHLLGRRSWEKYIPEEYLFAPKEWRFALMQGLMDTDGYVDSRGHMSYTTVSAQLSKDITHLARSLGAKVVVTTKIPTYTHQGEKKRGRLAYTVWITPHEPEQFVTLSRKVARIKKSQAIPAREVVDVRRTDRIATMRCITVDSVDGLYIVEDFVVTHNSDAILMSALQYVDVPGYNALILRRTYADLAMPEAIMNRAAKWLRGTTAQRKDGGRQWVFPSGATITFGYLQNSEDKHRYASAEFQFIGFDELTHFLEEDYTFLFSRLRKPKLRCLICNKKIRKHDGAWEHISPGKCSYAVVDAGMLKEYGPGKDGMRLWNVPLRMRSATNPGARGHAWVKRRFVDPLTRHPGSVFVPALLKDNPSLDAKEYKESLSHLTPVDRERLLRGDWDVMLEGKMFQRQWWQYGTVAEIPAGALWARFWDLAATEGGGDYTAGALVAHHEGISWIVDIQRDQLSPHQVERLVRRTAIRDAKLIGDKNKLRIGFEQEPGSSGKSLIDHYKRIVLPEFWTKGLPSSSSKELRASPISNAVEDGRVRLIPGRWNGPLLDEAALFPEQNNHDDQIDAISGAYGMLAKAAGSRIIV